MSDAHDMPKLESPFIRKMIDKDYVVTPEINQEYSWVFEDDKVLATEKLDGTNVSIVIEDGLIKSVWNRTNRIPILLGDWRIMEGLIESNKKGYIPTPDGQHFGELIGSKVNGNPYELDRHVWIPLKQIQSQYHYTSWGKYPKTYEAVSKWFQEDIFSLFMAKRGMLGRKPEGIVFYNPETKQMAKLRRDMFDWYKGKKHDQ